MTPDAPSPTTTTLRQLVTPYAKANHRRAWWQVATTLLPFALLWALIAATLERSGGWSLLLVLPLGRALHPAVHHPARLRARLLLRTGDPQPSAGRRPRRHHAVSILLLAQDPRDPPRHVREPRPAPVWRHRDPDGARIPVAGLVGTGALPPLPEHASAARDRAALPVRDQAPRALRPAAQLAQGMVQRHLERCRAARGRHGAVPGVRLENRAAAAPAP